MTVIGRKDSRNDGLLRPTNAALGLVVPTRAPVNGPHCGNHVALTPNCCRVSSAPDSFLNEIARPSNLSGIRRNVIVVRRLSRVFDHVGCFERLSDCGDTENENCPDTCERRRPWACRGTCAL